jgi:hypothetical protein
MPLLRSWCPIFYGIAIKILLLRGTFPYFVITHSKQRRATNLDNFLPYNPEVAC